MRSHFSWAFGQLFRVRRHSFDTPRLAPKNDVRK